MPTRTASLHIPNSFISKDFKVENPAQTKRVSDAGKVPVPLKTKGFP